MFAKLAHTAVYSFVQHATRANTRTHTHVFAHVLTVCAGACVCLGMFGCYVLDVHEQICPGAKISGGLHGTEGGHNHQEVVTTITKGRPSKYICTRNKQNLSNTAPLLSLEPSDRE